MCRFGATFQLFRRDIFFMCREMPNMTKWIEDSSHAITIELVLQSFLDRRSRGYRLIENRINVFNVNHEADGRAAKRLGSFVTHLCEFVGKHDWGIANLNFGVADFAIRRWKAK